MFKGSVRFVARIRGNGLTFPKIEYVPMEAGIDQVEIEASNGTEIQSKVHVTSVPSTEDGRALAAKVNKAAIDRIAFKHGIVIEDARRTEDHFSPIDSPEGTVCVSAVGTGALVASATVTVGVDAATIKKELEQPTHPGEQYYGFFRSARQSASPVEAYMHLYNLLLMLYEDSQADVDAFIRDQDPKVPQSEYSEVLGGNGDHLHPSP